MSIKVFNKYCGVVRLKMLDREGRKTMKMIMCIVIVMGFKRNRIFKNPMGDRSGIARVFRSPAGSK